MLCTLVLYEVIYSPLIFTFVLVVLVHLLYSKEFSTTKDFFKNFCVGLLELASL